MSSVEIDNNNNDEQFNILIATDIHIGHNEKDVELSDDAINTFEEILSIGCKRKVDFILLAGDLFHENKPSRRSIVKTMELLRRYCVGDDPVNFEMISDPSMNFQHCRFPVSNFDEDSFCNISMPVFSIHGNHDDPTGADNLCALDELATAGLINLFGKQGQQDCVQINPILLKKGENLLSIYGLGAMRDERLYKLFVQKKVQFIRPKEDTDEWMNIFCIHQNRVQHGPSNYIPEKFLPKFLDLVFWGHEHECKIQPMFNTEREFYVTQPGSTVVTQLSAGETVAKRIGLLMIKPKKKFIIKEIPLQTTRVFLMKDIVLSEMHIEPFLPKTNEDVLEYCYEIVNEMIDKADSSRTLTDNPKQPKLPLIRLRVDFSGGFEPFSFPRFGQKFVNKVANPKDLVKAFKKAKEQRKNLEDKSLKVEIDNKPSKLESSSLEVVIKEHFQKTGKSMTLLTEKLMNVALNKFVVKQDKDALSTVIEHILKITKDKLIAENVSIKSIPAKLEKMNDNSNDDDDKIDNIFGSSENKTIEHDNIQNSDIDMGQDSDNNAIEINNISRERVSKSRGNNSITKKTNSTRGKSSTSRRGGKQKKLDDMFSPKILSKQNKRFVDLGISSDDDEDSSFTNIPTKKTRGRK